MSARDSTDILENRKISFSCQDLNSGTLRLLVGKPAEGNGLLGSPTYREKENIKVNLKELGFEGLGVEGDKGGGQGAFAKEFAEEVGDFEGDGEG